MNHYRSYPENKLLFDTNIIVIKLIVKFITQITLQAPLLVTGYLFTNYLLNKNINLLIRIGLSICFAYIIYTLIYFMKGIIISLRFNKSLWWVPALLILAFFVCVLPILIVLQLDTRFITVLKANHFFPPLIVLIYFTYTYNRYCFLKNVAPRSVSTIYKAGISITNSLHHFKSAGLVTKIVFGR